MKTFISLILILTALAAYSQKSTNTWNGNDNTNWHDVDNWSLGHIPTVTEDVVVPTGISRYPSVYVTNEEINSLTIQSDAFIRIGPRELTIASDVYVYGEIIMYNTDAELHCQDIFWYSGSTAVTTDDCSYFVSGNWKYFSGAEVQLDDGFVFFVGSGSNYLISQDEDCYFNTIWVDKTGGVFGHSASSSTSCTIKKNLFLYGSNYDFLSYDAETIKIGSSLINGSSSVSMTLNKGTIEFTGNWTTCMLRPQPGDYINKLIVNTGSYDMDMNTNNASVFEIKNDVIINSGTLDAGSMDLLVGGDWTNNVGPDAFNERDQKVTFNSWSGHQYCSDETFYTLEVDKGVGAFRVNGTDVVCAEYDWTDGAVDVLSGSFTANDLVDDGLAGSWYVNDEVTLHQQSGHVDLLGELYIFDGGSMDIYGGNDDSNWPYGSAGSHLEMEYGSILDFHDVGINIGATGTLTTDITGGFISMAGDFIVNRSGFNDSGATWSLSGYSDAKLQIVNGNIYSVLIQKFGPGTVQAIDYVQAQSLAIFGGTFDVNGTPVVISDGITVTTGEVKMTGNSDHISCHDFTWGPTSNALVTNGSIDVSGDWTFESDVQLGTGNTVNFTGNSNQHIYCYDEDAEFGNVNINQSSGETRCNSASTHAIQIAGNLNIFNGCKLMVKTETLIVDGTIDINNGGILSLEDFGGELINNSDMDLTGKIAVDGGDAIIHGTFDIASTGELTVDGGSFGYDYGSGYCDIYGTLNISDGLFFVDEMIRIQSSADVIMSGGTIKGASIAALTANTFKPSGGVFESQTDNGANGTYNFHATNYFHDLKINPLAGGGGWAYSDVHINNSLNVSAGRLYFDGHTVTVDNDVTIYGGLRMDNSDDELIVGDDIFWKSGSEADLVSDGEIHVNGNWTFENGTQAQLGSGNIVRFTGSGSSNIYNYDADASFGSLMIQKTSGSNSYINGGSIYPVHCTGGLSVESNSNFHIQHEDLIVDQGIYIGSGSTLDMLSNGSLQDGNDMDVYGTLDIDGGEAAVNGDFSLYSIGTLNITDGSLVCNDPYDYTNKKIQGNFNLTGDGLFEITNNSIEIFSTANCNITGGTIRVGGNFFATNAGTFQPTGGNVEMSDGYVGGQIFCNDGNSFYNLDIKDDILVGDDFIVDHDLDISSVELDINSHTVEVGHDVNIYGNLTMTNSLGVLECDGWILWYPGSTDNITAGNIYTHSWIFEEGTNAMLGTGNTVHLEGGMTNNDEDAEFGNLIGGVFSKADNNKNKLYTPMRVAGYFTLLSGNDWSFYDDMIVQGIVDIEAGASLSVYNDNTLFTYSDFTLNGLLDLSSQGNGYVDGEFHIASTGELIIEGGEFIIESTSTGYNNIWGTLTMTDGLFQINRNLRFMSSATTNISGGMIRTTGFFAPYSGTFEPGGGVVEIQNHTNGYSPIEVRNGNYLYNLNINRAGTSGGAYLNDDLLVTHNVDVLLGFLSFDEYTATVQGNTTIFDGGLRMEELTALLNAGNDPSDEIIWKSASSFEWNNMGRINIFGNCTIENGVTDNIEATQTFAFVGSGAQNLYNFDDATFGIIELDKPSSALVIASGSTVECQSYDWTQGNLTINGGSFTALDLADPGLYGTNFFYAGEAHFYQDNSQFSDLNGNIILQNAIVTIEGGLSYSYWGWAGDIDVTMSGGELNFIDNGIELGNDLHSMLTENITGGIIRTNGILNCERSGFAPTGGTVELIGSSLQKINLVDGQLHNLLINKTETDQGMATITNRKGEQIIPLDATNVQLTDNLVVNGTTTIESGQLETMGYDMSCYDDVDVNSGGTFSVTPSSQISMTNTCDIDINSGGILEALGEAGNEAVFTHITGNYDININTGGTISASHAIFEYLETSGLDVTLDASIDPANPLNNCTFRYGKTNGTLLMVNNDQTLTIDGAEFYTNGAENYNVKKIVNLGEITFTNFGGDFAGAAHEEDPYNRIHWFEPELSVSPSNQNVSAEAGTVTYEITANTAWIITEAEDWLGVSPMTGNGNATVTVNYDENTTILSRIGSINISAPGSTSVNVTLTQAGVDLELSVSPSNHDVSYRAGVKSFEILSNTNWSVSDTMDWLFPNLIGGSGDETLEVYFQKNTTGIERVGEITITADTKVAVVVTVTQSGEIPTLSADPEYLDVLAPNGIGFLNVYSNTNWTITDNMDWLGLNLEFPSGNVVVTVSVGMNMTGEVRSGEITVETEDGSIQIVIPVTQQYFVEHIVSLPAGWSGLSSYALPTPPFIEGVFSGISDELIIALTEEEIYYPEYGVNTIGMWEEFSAYKIKTNEAVDLEIYGSTYPNKSMTIPTGWSLLPVISECPVDVEDLFAPVVSDIQIVKEVAGYGIYWPDMGINTLGVLNPGKAYYVLSTANVEITFGDCAKATAETLTVPHVRDQTLSEFSPWELTNPTTSSHSIAIPQVAIQDFEKGSILGAFDEEGKCFGLVPLDGKASCLTIFGDDELTAEKDGFADGEQIFFRILKPSTKEEIELIPEFDLTLPAYDGKFAEHGLSAITGFKEGSTGIAGLGLENVRVYPNPSTGTFNISGLQAGTEITITDIRGQIVFSGQSISDIQQAIDLQKCNPGIYMIGIKQQDNSSFHKMIVK